MWNCPICNAKNKANICEECGYERKSGADASPEERVVSTPNGAQKMRPVGFNKSLLKTIAVSENYLVALQKDGKLLTKCFKLDLNYYLTVKPAMAEWQNIISVSAGETHIVGLKSNGTVVATGNNWTGMCDVEKWTDIVAIDTGPRHTLGLKSDGTVVAAGKNLRGRCDVSDWKDIIAIAAGEYHSVGLKSDGTVVTAGLNFNGCCDVAQWKDIVAVAAGKCGTIGIQSDGAVVFAGSCGVQTEESKWHDIVSVASDVGFLLGLRSDGTVALTGYEGHRRVGAWTDVVDIATCMETTVGLKSDGTLLVCGKNRPNVTKWRDIRVIPREQ